MCVWLLPSVISKDLRDGALERVSCADLIPTEWGAFAGAGADLAAEFTPQESQSARPASSLELESGLLVQVGVCRGPGNGGLSLSCGEEQVLEELFCSEECEERESMLPIGVLPELLLNVSPAGTVRHAADENYSIS